MDPELPAYVTLDEVAEVAGIGRDVLTRYLMRRGALRRIGRSRYVDTGALGKIDGALHARLLQRRVQRAMQIDPETERNHPRPIKTPRD